MSADLKGRENDLEQIPLVLIRRETELATIFRRTSPARMRFNIIDALSPLHVAMLNFHEPDSKIHLTREPA